MDPIIIRFNNNLPSLHKYHNRSHNQVHVYNTTHTVTLLLPIKLLNRGLFHSLITLSLAPFGHAVVASSLDRRLG